MGNQIKTTILLGLLTAFILWVGNILGGRGGMVIALLFAGGLNFFSYWYSDKVVLKMYRARQVDPGEGREIHEIVEQLAKKAGLPMPKVYIIPQEAPNAFATGRNPDHAVVAVTEGLLDIMDRDEIRGVLAHELSHVKNRDTLISTIAATMAGAVMMLASIARWSAIFGAPAGGDDEGGMGILGLIVMSILAPIGALLIQMAISRSREYMADQGASEIEGDPESLASALEKLANYNKKIRMNADPATAHLFIVNPLSGSKFASLFSTHPPVEERIARLRGNKPSRKSDDENDQDGQERTMEDEARNMWDRLSR